MVFKKDKKFILEKYKFKSSTSKNEEEINNENEIENELNKLVFTKVIKKDNGNCFKYFFSIFCEKQIFFSTTFPIFLVFIQFFKIINLCFILSFFFF